MLSQTLVDLSPAFSRSKKFIYVQPSSERDPSAVIISLATSPGMCNLTDEGELSLKGNLVFNKAKLNVLEVKRRERKGE